MLTDVDPQLEMSLCAQKNDTSLWVLTGTVITTLDPISKAHFAAKGRYYIGFGPYMVHWMAVFFLVRFVT